MTTIATAHTALKERKVFKSHVEVEVRDGFGIHLVGMTDNYVRDSLLRVCTALDKCGYRIPGKKVIINIAPTFLHKNTAGFDLPIALGLLIESGQMVAVPSDVYFIGELGRDGEILPTDDEQAILAELKAEEVAGASLPIDSVNYYGFPTLEKLILHYEKIHYICGR